MRKPVYEKLVAWKRAMALVVTVHHITRRFPTDEKSGLVATMRRTVAIIPAKIADGHGRGDKQAYAKALADALATLRELQTQVVISRRLGYLSMLGTWKLRKSIRGLSTMLNELMLSLDDKQDSAKSCPERTKPRLQKMVATLRLKPRQLVSARRSRCALGRD